jgi:hypothetical protein
MLISTHFQSSILIEFVKHAVSNLNYDNESSRAMMCRERAERVRDRERSAVTRVFAKIEKREKLERSRATLKLKFAREDRGGLNMGLHLRSDAERREDRKYDRRSGL